MTEHHTSAGSARALAEELREYTAMKYAGDCKCGKCQLVPRALVERIYHTLNGSTFDLAQAVGMRTALERAQKIIERDYPNGQLATDIRAVLAAQPPAAPVGRGCCSKCRNISECEAGCKLACTCGGDPGQPASEHDISCPAGLSPFSAGTAKLRSGLAAELMAFHDLCTQNSAGGDGEYRVECSSGSAEQARALRAVLREAAAALQNDLPQTAWKCFHCSETFSDPEAAKVHFGDEIGSTPGCKLNALEGGLLKIVRDQEEELRQFRREDTASYREFYSLGADHSRALVREEQKGYDKGLADARAEAEQVVRSAPSLDENGYICEKAAILSALPSTSVTRPHGECGK